ncbi:MAG: glycosyltransferase family 4 protein [Legionella sp.]|nr:glycosyltransferase family 4 protein [Legionella sp.]
MKKLLVFTENYARGGGNRYMIDIVNAVADNYNDIVFASNAGGIFPNDVTRLQKPAFFHHLFFLTGARIREALDSSPKRPSLVFSLFLRLLEPFFFMFNVLFFMVKIKKIKPSSVISCNGGYPAAQASLAMVVAAKVLGIPVALTIVSMPTPRKTYWRLYEKIIDKLVWSSASVVIVNAKAIDKALQEMREIPPGLSQVIYNGLEDMELNDSVKTRGENFIIGCIARMDVAKGVLHLLDAFAILAIKYPHLQLVLAGEGDASPLLLERVQELSLQRQVKLLGHYSGDVGALLETFDIYVFPSLWEGFPYSIIESMRSRSTIVATAVGGIPEAITHGEEGLLIEPGEVNEIVQAIECLMADDEMRLRLANNARLKFEQKLSLQKMHSSAEETLRQLTD